MTNLKKLLPIVSLLGLWQSTSFDANASSLLLDFGPTVTTATDAQSDPGHAIGAIPSTEISWNNVAADKSSLIYSDGTAATGVSIDLGRSAAVGFEGDDVIDFNNNSFSSSALGGTQKTGIYAGTSPVKDGIFGGSGGTNNLAVGIRVDGLSAGVYTLIVHGRNTSTAPATPMRFYAASGPSATTFAFSLSNSNTFLANTSPVITTSFLEDDNFGILTMTVAAGESLFVACEGTSPIEARGFMNAVEIISGTPSYAAKISFQPANKGIMETATAVFISGGNGTEPLLKQWRFNGSDLAEDANVSGVHSNVLTLRNVTALQAGTYSLFVSNALGTDLSSNATLTVTPVLNTEQMSNIWNLSPGDREYVTTGSYERGLAFNSVTTNLLFVSRSPVPHDPTVAVLDPATGAEKYFLDVSGIPSSTAGVSFGLNQIGISDDGVVYGAGLSINAGSTPYNIYRWSDDSAGSAPVLVFAGDPGAGAQPGSRWGDTFAVRGSGADTQMLIGPGTGTNVVLLRTSSTFDFQTEIPPTIIAVDGVPSGFARYSLAFGPGTNTFWAKAASGTLYLIQFDLTSNTGTVIQNYPATFVPGSVRGVGMDKNGKFLAGISVESPNDNVRIYDISDLVAGPLMRDQEAYSTQNNNANGTACVAFGGNYLFALDTDNGLKAFLINTNYVAPSVSIVTQPTPATRTVLEGADAVFSAVAASIAPLNYQWSFNGTNLVDGPNISGANTNVLTIHNTTANSAGTYTLFVNNVYGSALSSNAVLTVNPVFNTAQMSNVWNILPDQRVYVGTGGTERGMAFNSVTTNLLLVSRSPSESVVVLDAQTGAEKRFLDVTGIPGSVTATNFGLSTIGVADDGAVFAAGLTINTTFASYTIYRWPNDSAGNPPTVVFNGDPADNVQPGLRWGDNIAVRGAGNETQILIAPGSGTNVVLLRSTSGLDFHNEIAPAVISVSGVPSAFAQIGLAFGPGTNTFWAKNASGSLYLIQFDLNAKTGTVLHSYTTNTIPNTLRGISVDKDQKFLAGMATEVSDTVRIYDISNLEIDPVLRDQEVFATSNPNITVGGTGVTAFGGNYLFALDSNNGLKAFLINTNYVPTPTTFSISSVSQNAGNVILTWDTAAGSTYQVQFKNSLSDATWSNLDAPIVATGNTLSFTNSTAASPTRFYRIQSQ